MEKLIFWTVITCFFSVGLILVSCRMLNVGPHVTLLSALTAFSCGCVLTGISLGLGAYFADFKRDYYLNAVESLGGVIALVANFAYVALGLFLFIRAGRLFFAGKAAAIEPYIVPLAFGWLVFSLILVLMITRLGLRKLEAKEY